VLRHPATGEIRYVGKTVQEPKKRLGSHCSAASTGKQTHVARWIRTLDAPPVMEVIEEVEGSGSDREVYWIATMREMGVNLTNASDGGEDGWTDKARAAIRRGPLSEETKRKIGDANRGRRHTEATRAVISAKRAKQVIVHSPETREKIRQSLVGSKRSPESCQKMSDAKQAYLKRKREGVA
jgi:hypothetical protein